MKSLIRRTRCCRSGFSLPPLCCLLLLLQIYATGQTPCQQGLLVGTDVKLAVDCTGAASNVTPRVFYAFDEVGVVNDNAYQNRLVQIEYVCVSEVTNVQQQVSTETVLSGVFKTAPYPITATPTVTRVLDTSLPSGVHCTFSGCYNSVSIPLNGATESVDVNRALLPTPCIVDLNECAANTDDCGPNSMCVNTLGGFSCLCRAGYASSGTAACTNVDECSTGLHDCSRHTKCTDTEGSFSCTCAEGYQGDGRNCSARSIPPSLHPPPSLTPLDVDECSASNDSCGADRTCVNSNGTYRCSCLKGYHMDADGCVVSAIAVPPPTAATQGPLLYGLLTLLAVPLLVVALFLLVCVGRTARQKLIIRHRGRRGHAHSWIHYIPPEAWKVDLTFCPVSAETNPHFTALSSMESVFDRLQTRDGGDSLVLANTNQTLIECCECVEGSNEGCSQCSSQLEERESAKTVKELLSCEDSKVVAKEEVVEEDGREEEEEEEERSLLSREVNEVVVEEKAVEGEGRKEEEERNLERVPPRSEPGHVPTSLNATPTFQGNSSISNGNSYVSHNLPPLGGCDSTLGAEFELASPLSAQTSGIGSGFTSGYIDSSFASHFTFDFKSCDPPVPRPLEWHSYTESRQHSADDDACDIAVVTTTNSVLLSPQNSESLFPISEGDTRLSRSVTDGTATPEDTESHFKALKCTHERQVDCGSGIFSASSFESLDIPSDGCVASISDFPSVCVVSGSDSSRHVCDGYVGSRPDFSCAYGSESSKNVGDGYVVSESDFSSAYIMSGSESSRQSGSGYVISESGFSSSLGPLMEQGSIPLSSK